ncbi:MAG: DUF5702 domain-containing protein [Eubacterium sp.]
MKARGSMTVFLALLLTCMLSAVFAFLEAARVSGLNANVQMCTMQAGDGVLASYHRDLWKQYGFLAWQGDFPEMENTEQFQKDLIAGNLGDSLTKGNNFYVIYPELTEVEVKAFELATDRGGMPFRLQAARCMKQNLTEDAVKKVLQMMTAAGGNSEEQAVRQEEEALNVLETLQGKDQNPEKEKESADSPAQSGERMTENPIAWMKKIKKNGILSVVMPEEELSEKHADFSHGVSRRALRKGTFSAGKKETLSDRVLFQLYLYRYFTDVTEAGTDGCLDYRMEYLIVGKNSDKANVKGVVHRLILLREVSNMTFLETHPEKQKTALAVAAAITAAVGQPELTEPVKQGILAAWAYAESLSDVRILLEGGKVSLVKTEEQWHTQLDKLSASVREQDGKKQQQGLSYANYLQLLLWSMQEEKLTYRAMDLMEKDIAVSMDEMVTEMSCRYEYGAHSLFWNFVRLGKNSVSGYRFQDNAVISYLVQTK